MKETRHAHDVNDGSKGDLEDVDAPEKFGWDVVEAIHPWPEYSEEFADRKNKSNKKPPTER